MSPSVKAMVKPQRTAAVQRCLPGMERCVFTEPPNGLLEVKTIKFWPQANRFYELSLNKDLQLNPL